jgi:hypothetical protein
VGLTPDDRQGTGVTGTGVTLRRLLTVEDTFLIRGRGLLVVPAPRLDEARGPATFTVELRRPEGVTTVAELTLSVQFLSPTPTVHRWAVSLQGLTMADVPIGTEIWCDEAYVVDAARSREGDSTG